jgi:hypothetical protein
VADEFQTLRGGGAKGNQIWLTLFPCYATGYKARKRCATNNVLANLTKYSMWFLALLSASAFTLKV